MLRQHSAPAMSNSGSMLPPPSKEELRCGTEAYEAQQVQDEHWTSIVMQCGISSEVLVLLAARRKMRDL